VEFLETFVSLPCASVPHEFDLPAVASAEMVACLLTELRLFAEDALDGAVFFHPQSFSAAAKSRALEGMTSISAAPAATDGSSKNKAKARRKTQLKNLKRCAVVSPHTFRCEGIKFGSDILLKIRK
jgi:hypothetical protein